MTVAKMEDLASIAFQFDKSVTALRPGQYDCIADLIRQNNVVAIIPTGGGKSLIWLLPALIIKRIDTQGVWFESNSTSKIDARQQPEPCYIRTIIAIHSTPARTLGSSV
jgi:hypothetical protein